jgi:flavin reductase (DIM6/NTAB) family NADH-FMN oxidoreductase RutF
MQKRVEISEAIGRKYPEPVVLVTTRSRAGKPNVMAVGWVSVASSEPLMFVLGIDDEAHTCRLIRRTRQFVVAFPGERQAKETLFVGTRHGYDVDKFAACALKAQRAAGVKAPLVADAVANFECRLVEITRPGDCPLIVGRVVAAHVNTRKSLRRLYTVGQGHKLAGVRARR